MRKSTIRLIVLCITISFVLLACNFGFRNQADDGELVTPYMTPSVARSVSDISSTSPDVVDWRVARFFAVLEKIEFESVYPWHGASVSEYPVVIYNTDSKIPRYYEFRVIKNGIEVGSISCNASKLDGEPIAYVSEMTHKVTKETAKKLTDPFSGSDLININYPVKFISRELSTSSKKDGKADVIFKDALTEKPIEAPAVFTEKKLVDFLNEANTETLLAMEINEVEKQQMLDEAQETVSDIKALWAAIDEITPQILATTDEEIEREYQNPDAIIENPLGRCVYKTETEDSYYFMLKDWYDKREWYNTGGDCGSAAVTFIALGLGEKAGFDKIPLYNNDYYIFNLYKIFLETMGHGPKVISSLSKGLSTHTNYKIDQKLCHRWNDVNNHLVNYNLPVLSLRSGWYGDWGFHYRVIIGTKTVRKREYHKLSWWWFGWKSKYWTKDKYTNWYYMHDNTSDTKSKHNSNVDGKADYGNFWEKSGGVYQSTLGLVKHK